MVFVFAEYFRGLNRRGLTGGTISFFKAITALAKTFDVRVFSFDPESIPNDLGELSARTIYLPPLKMGGLRLAATWNTRLRRAYVEAVADYGVPAAIIAVSDTLPVLAFPETRSVKRIAVLQAYESFGAFIPGGSLADRVAGIKRSLKTQFLSARGVRSADLVVVNSHYMGRAAEITISNISYESYISAPVSFVFSRVCATNRSKFVDGRICCAHNQGKNLPLVISLAEAMPEVVFRVFGHLTDIPPTPRQFTVYGLV